MTLNKKPFVPDYATHPGEILQEILETKNITGAELARRSGLSEKHISQIINCIAPVTPETAIQLERILGVSANIWNNLDAQYRLFIAKEAENKDFETQKKWAEKFPLKELKKRGLLPTSNKTSETINGLLDFFGVGNISAWETQFNRMVVSFRHSPAFKSKNESLAAWLRIGEIYANNIDCKKYNKIAFLEALRKIRQLTNEKPSFFQPKLTELCSNAGVAVVLVKELPDIHLSGATRWLNTNKAMIILTLRHKSDDHLWFSFFHEAGHILLHKKNTVFIDGFDNYSDDSENEADLFSANFLIPEKDYTEFLKYNTSVTKSAILEFADKINIAPGVIVGRLQHDNIINYSYHNKLKRKFSLG